VANHESVDVLIVGGGLIGALLILALANTGLKTLMIDRKPLPDKSAKALDVRTLALSPASVRILKQLTIWNLLADAYSRIDSIHISQQGYFGSAQLHHENNEPLGYVLEIDALSRALHERFDLGNIKTPATLIDLDRNKNEATVNCSTGTEKIQFRLLVAADGAESMVRQLCNIPVTTKDYAQSAIVANIGLKRSHHNIAYERFTPTGPIALLPMLGLRAGLVWPLPPHDALEMRDIDDSLFLSKIQRAFGYRAGRFTQLGKRMLYPLKQIVQATCVTESIVFVGNAAHTLHPVAGQGFNLGLRDVAMLVQCINTHGLTQDMLNAYQSARKADHEAIRQLTDGLVSLFTKKYPGLPHARGLGLLAFDNIPLLKQCFAHTARGFHGTPPNWACGIP
jgi:2-octaprenyl-6-methoxyphenol hydroxylase